MKQLKCLNRQKTAKYRREDNYYVLYTTSAYEKQERTHLKKAYVKLGVNNKAEATRLVVEAEENGMNFHPDE